MTIVAMDDDVYAAGRAGVKAPVICIGQALLLSCILKVYASPDCAVKSRLPIFETSQLVKSIPDLANGIMAKDIT